VSEIHFNNIQKLSPYSSIQIEVSITGVNQLRKLTGF
jgi:hypothetical protein